MTNNQSAQSVSHRRRFLSKFLLGGLAVTMLSLPLIAGKSGAKSKKKGFCGSNAKGHQQIGAHWFYNWWSAGGKKNSDIDFVPMIKGKINLGPKSFKHIETQKSIKFMLGYNEPERKKQGDLSVADGLKHWPRLVKLAEKRKIKLGSPAVSSDMAGLKWLDAFMKGAKKKNLRIDFLAIHWYGGTNVNEFKKFIDRMHKKYGLPIWVTEFNGWNGTHKEMESFAIKSFDMLEKHKNVIRYAYFSKRKGEPGSLWNKDGSLSKIGLALKAR